MSVIRKYDPGEFCWCDLATKDVAGAKKFYRGIFGWVAKDIPMGTDGSKYSMMCLAGKDVCGIYPMQDAQKKMKAPPFWLPYISVKSVNGTARRARAARGKIGMGPMDVMDKGRMAIVHDPTGAGFAIWQAGTHRGAALDDKPGTVLWHDLNTPKPAVAGKFYTAVFGWATQNEDIGGDEYHVFTLNKDTVCGMWPRSTKKLPPSWLTHWEVANCARTVAKAKRLGGRVLMGPIPIPGRGHFAILKDPQGAAFGIIGA